MLFEFKHIVNNALVNQQNGLKNVLATVVFLEGSSYRKPGVRMLICENGTLTGAVSGGCVENDVVRRAQSVFKDNKSKVMTYDGRYRLGCEGVLYILIEPFYISNNFLKAFIAVQKQRQAFQITSYFRLEDESVGNYGSVVSFSNNSEFTFQEEFVPNISDDLKTFQETLQPCFKLIIIGSEHDAVKLCSMSSLLGWEVHVLTSLKDPKRLSDFPGATSVSAETPELNTLAIDGEMAVVLMNHNYVQDLKYLIKLEPLKPKYVGILGSSTRREQLQNELVHYLPELSEDFFDSIYSPAGLHIGAITPEEIALSILSEILSVVRQTETVSLRTVAGKLHN